MRVAVWAVLMLVAAGAQNLWPDPSFEQSGVEGVARSGQKAGYVRVDAPLHWQAIGGEFGVEPYATYRAVAWAKARHDGGSALALYTYAWDSYVWAFGSQARIANGGDWQQVEVTFCSPYRQILLHPLALLDVNRGEAWIDDLTIERVASPAETIAVLRAKPQLAADEARLLARWHLDQGDLAAARAVAERTGDRPARADIACIVGLATDDLALRRSMLIDMVLNGATGYNDGMRRLDEVAAPLDRVETLRALAEAVGEAGDAASAEGFAAYADRQNFGGGPLGTLGERSRQVRQSIESLNALADRFGDPARLRLVRLRLEQTAKRLEREMEQLGSCTVRLDGHLVTPDSHAIVLAAEPTPQEQTAARDLRAHLEKVTGRLFDIVTPAERTGRAGILIGQASDLEVTGLGDEGLIIRSDGADLHLTGGTQRGVLYAVYVFLEDHLGCRWFAPDCSTWPTTGRIDLPALDVRHVPLLEYRATDYPRHRPPEFAVRNRYNGTQINAGSEWGGKVSYKGFVHTFNALVPPEQYFDAHPEYFSEVGGKRLRDYTQLCLTNPDVLRIATESVRRWIAESPEATIISVSQNDWHNACDCPNCHALAEREGAQSGPLLHFVNAIAEAIEADHPQIIIDTLAYQYTRRPPRHVRPRDNVAVRLCSIECEFNRPIATSAYNASFVDDIKGWNAICDRLHIWDYVINYAHSLQPFPNLRVLAPNIRFFIDNGVTGIYEEACYWTPGSESQELRSWLMAKLLWNPEFDVEAGIVEFCDAYYGAASPFIQRYLADSHDLAVSDDNFHMPIYVGPTAPFQTDEAMARYEGWFDAAEAAVAGDETLLHRVEVARLPLYYTLLAKRGGQTFRRTDEALVPAAESPATEALEAFARIARAEGITSVSENHGWGALETFLQAQQQAGVSYPLVTIFGGGLEAQVLPGIGGRLFSLRWADDGTELLQIDSVDGGIDPKVGGYKEFSRITYQSPGWSEGYEVTESSARSVTVRGRLANGLAFERTYTLEADEPVLHVRSRLTNVSDEPREATIRVHACFRLPDPLRAGLRVGGELIPLTLPAGSRQSERSFNGADLPGGEWSLVDPVGGNVITNRFDPARVTTCYSHWSRDDQRGNLELWPSEVRLAPGESTTLEHSYRIERR